MRWTRAIVRCAGAAAASAALAGHQSPVVLQDAVGDAALHATRPAAQGPAPTSALPDVVSVSILPWTSPTPSTDPYTGSVQLNHPHLVRVDIVFAGLICPPGTVGISGQPFAPFMFGASPVYGFVEFDMDSERDTGGELGAGAGSRYLGVIGRFGARPQGSVGERMAEDASDVDLDFNTWPQIERSGQDYSLVFCGCMHVSISQRLVGNANDTFEPNEVWIVRGRLLQRAGGYQAASAAFGGSAPGLYDPYTNLRWAHDAPTNRTTVSLVAALTPTGASMLTGQPTQPIDYNVGNHTSVQEAIQDVIDGVNIGGFGGPAWTLCFRWRNEEVEEALDPTKWKATGHFGAPYAWQGGYPYAWTDSIGRAVVGDFVADGSCTGSDLVALLAVIAAQDGGPTDCDGAINSAVAICDFGPNWSMFDVNNDGVIRASDFPTCPGDANGDRVVDFLDLNIVLSNYGMSGAALPGDLNADGVVDFNDLNTVLSAFGAVC